MSTLKKLKKHVPLLLVLAIMLYLKSTLHFAYVLPKPAQEYPNPPNGEPPSPPDPPLIPIPPQLPTTPPPSLPSSPNTLVDTSNPANIAALQLLTTLNTTANLKIHYVPDGDDYWQTPAETETLLTGDCEDYVIYKLSLALQAGLPPSQLRLLYVKTLSPDNTPLHGHMVLLYYPPSNEPHTETNADPLVLDNLISTIRPLSKRTDLFPLYSFNTNTLWIGASNTPSTKKTSQLRKWTHVINSTPLFQYPGYAQPTPTLQSLQKTTLPLNATIPSTSTGAP